MYRLGSRRLGLVAAALVGVTALSACGGDGGSGGRDAAATAPGVTATTITLGTTTPLTGPAGPSCRPLRDAAEAWFNHVNSKGGIHGRQVKQVVLDDQYQAPLALANAKQLVQKPVFAIFGGCGSIQPPAVETVAEPAKVPYLFPTASLPDLATKSNVFLALPSYDKQMEALTTFAMETYGKGSVYVVSQQIPNVEKIVEGITKSAAAQGQKVLGTDLITAGQADLGPTILKIKAARPDYLAVNVGSDAARLLDGLTKQNALPTKKIIGYSAVLTAGAQAASKALPEGMLIAASGVAAPDSPEMSECAAVMNAKSPDLIADANANFTCAAAQAMTSALEAAGKDLTRESLSKTMLAWKEFEASPALAPLTFTEGNRSGSTKLFAVKVTGGKIEALADMPLSP